MLSRIVSAVLMSAAVVPAAAQRPSPVRGLSSAAHRLADAVRPHGRDDPLDLEARYGRAARFHDGTRNPVIVIPGILGSKLVEGATGRVVWGAFGRGAADPRRAEGTRLIGHPLGPGVPLVRLTDGVRAAAPLARVDIDLLGLPLHVHAYGMILRTLGAGGFVDEDLADSVDYGDGHFTCFTFAYDWRRDNAESAAALAAFVEQKAAYVRRERKRRFGVDRPVRFDVVAHSMGGLVARHYLRYGGNKPTPGEPTSGGPVPFAGASRVARLILVAPPNHGAALAVDQLVAGYRVAPVFPRYEPALLATMPSVYQLLPRPRHGVVVDGAGRPVDLYDVATWERLGWGLLDPDQADTLAALLPEFPAADRRILAREHVAKCLAAARRFHAALDVPAEPPEGTEIHLFVGDGVETTARIVVDPRTGEPTPVRGMLGDDTVTRASALADERADPRTPWRPAVAGPLAADSTTILEADHLGITASPTFANNVLHLLLERREE